MNLLQFLKRKDGLSAEGFSEQDALVCSWLSYYGYGEDLVLGRVPLKDADPDVPGFYYDASYRKDAEVLFPLLQEHPRYKDWTVGDFKRVLQDGVQMEALRVEVAPSLSVLSFRGATPSFDSWEECISFGLKEETGGEKEALAYTREMLEKFPVNFYLTGHSKGGHFALFVYSRLSGEEKKRILGVYLFDPPGFSYPLPIEKDDPKVVLFVPPRSGIGILFAQDTDGFTVVKTRTFFSYGHDALLWKIRDGNFVRGKRMKHGAEHRRKAFNRWVGSLSQDEIREFTGIVFTALKKTGRKDFYDLLAHPREGKKTLKKSGYWTRKRKEYVRSILHVLVRFYFFPFSERK